MPWIPDQIGETSPGAGDGDVITNEWANLLRDASTISFATAAERDTYWPAATAPLGALCVTRDNGGLWQLADKSGARRWSPPWSVGWGEVIAPAVTATPQAGIGNAMTDLVGLAITPTAVANRRWRVTLYVPRLVMAAVGSELLVNLYNGATVIQQARFNVAHLPAGGATGPVALEAFVTSPAGAVALKAAAQCTVSTVSTAYAGGATSTLAAVDIGPATVVPAQRPGES